jgi:hypothetical protein
MNSNRSSSRLNLFRDIFPAARCVLLICFLSTTNTPQLAAGIFYFIIPRKGPLHAQSQRMNGGIEQPLPSALRDLAIARVSLDVRNEPCVEDRLAIIPGVETAIQVEL